MNVYIIAGSNGAGKTTFAEEFLPAFFKTEVFLNADLIASSLSPDHPESTAIAAGREMLSQIQSYAKRGEDFALETTLSGKGHLRLIHQLKQMKYKTYLFYLWTPSVDTVISRVKDRVRKGGHNIPEAVIRRRFGRSLRNFFAHYQNAMDEWFLIDNSTRKPLLIAFQRGNRHRILRKDMYSEIERQSRCL